MSRGRRWCGGAPGGGVGEPSPVPGGAGKAADEGEAVVTDDVRLSVGETSGPLAVARLDGELDMMSAPEVYVRATELLESHPHLVLDLSGVTFCDSTGFNVLLRLRRRVLEAEGWLALAAPPPKVGQLLALTGTEDVFAVYDSPAAAVAAHPGDDAGTTAAPRDTGRP